MFSPSGVLTSRRRLSAAELATGAKGRLRVVGRAGVGVDNIDLVAALGIGIAVVNSPGASTNSARKLGAKNTLRRWGGKALLQTERKCGLPTRKPFRPVIKARARAEEKRQT